MNGINNFLISLIRVELGDGLKDIDKHSYMPTIHKAMVDFYRNTHYHSAVFFMQLPDSNIRDTVSCTMSSSMLDINKSAFISNGRPVIVFEGHIFWDELKFRGINPSHYALGNEDILYEKWTNKYYREGALEYERLDRAVAIDEIAAYRATGWGAFNIMGNTYSKCGCENINDFIGRMYESRAEQLFLLTTYINNTGGAQYLQKLDWAKFAEYFFGSTYRENMYDVKLAKAYHKYAD